ncbi:G-protein coupled receptor 183-like [Dicentrarchus labrax]|uniref:G-protein coupled receptor 183-like n=1 Tax=Dicentrarchus labrax TaxID=13489 RepID=UPI0021F5B280|nr:G-protein coupled receptor 183-like [Dicentrarchus labrax]
MAKGSIEGVLMQCRGHGLSDFWFGADISVLIIGVLANGALLWLFLRERKSLSASQVLGVNLVAMDLVYLSILPVSLLLNFDKSGNSSDFTDINWEIPNNPDPLYLARDVFSMFNLIGCPLLLTCMCIERYLAVTRPVLYLRVRKWEYKMAVSAVVWCVTFIFCLAMGLVGNSSIIMIPVSIIISSLFFLMLACLVGVVQSLRQQSPAHTTYGNKVHSKTPLKRRAVNNVLVVVVPAVISYVPVLIMLPLTIYIYYANRSLFDTICVAVEIFISFPRFGVLIGPLFYLSKARQTCCHSEIN